MHKDGEERSERQHLSEVRGRAKQMCDRRQFFAKVRASSNVQDGDTLGMSWHSEEVNWLEGPE